MPKKKTYRTIFIVCEGSNTEPNYFGRLAEKIDEERRLRVEVYPKPPVFAEGEAPPQNRKSTPLELVEFAQKQLLDGTYDEAWAVFDRDGYTRHADAFRKARQKVVGKTVRIAFSSIAFEHWILLHFEQNAIAFEKSAHLIEAYFVQKTLYPNYGKNRKTDPYPFLADQTFTALENAAWLRHLQKTAVAQANGNLFEVNPYTDVDELVKELLGVDLSISWTSFGQSTSFAGHQIRFEKAGRGVEIEFTNQSRASIVFNAQNLSDYFSFRPAAPLELIENILVAPGETVSFVLRCAVALNDDCLLIFKIGSQHLFIA